MSFTCRIMQYILPFIRIFQKKIKPFLKEGQLYALSNFEVGTYNEFCRPIQNEYKIIFLPTTNIQKLTEIEVNIPHHKFEFVDYNTIVQ